MHINFSEDPSDLISRTLGQDAGRNDLAVQVENATEYEFKVYLYYRHGSALVSRNELEHDLIVLDPHTIDHDAGVVLPGRRSLGMSASFSGCNVGLLISGPTRKKELHTDFLVIAATPRNKTNYTKVKRFTAPPTTKTRDGEVIEDLRVRAYWLSADKEYKSYASDEFAYFGKRGGFRVATKISEGSPATAFIKLYRR